jgi:hypothetical protein
VLKLLLTETEDLVRSIVRMDERISCVVNQRMENSSGKLSSFYHASRVANSYIRQSKLTGSHKIAIFKSAV